MKNSHLTIAAVLTALALPSIAATSSKSSTSKSKSSASSSKSKAEQVESIPAEQVTAQKLAKDLTTTQESKLLVFLNEATLEELEIIRGISTRRGAAIEKGRPFDSVDEVILIAGIGESTFTELVKHGKTLTRSRSSSKTSRKS